MHSTQPSRSERRLRTGGVMMVMAIILPVLVMLAAFCINAAQMQLTRTQLMVATDAAARSAGRTFSEEQDLNVARQAAAATAALNDVNNEPFLLNPAEGSGEIVFGTAEQASGNGRFEFAQSANVSELVEISAVKIFGRRDSGSMGGPVPLVFPSVFSRSDFSPLHDAVAMQVDRDIVLVLDRSGSMEWPTFDWPSGSNPWSYNALNAGVSAGLLSQNWRGQYYYANGNDSTSYQQWAWEEHFGLGPSPNTPWQDLLIAIQAFLGVLDQTPQNEQVAIASYASSGSRDLWLTTEFGDVTSTVNALNTGGSTAIGLGMQQGFTTFEHANARPFATKTMVVMTDGNHNRGIDPDDVAVSLMSTGNLDIQTVTFGGGANQQAMIEVANIGNGNHYHAESGAELASVFEEIANNLPTILTE
ncbi:MAG: Tad domain-containing protein [Planctomycetota bacterium]